MNNETDNKPIQKIAWIVASAVLGVWGLSFFLLFINNSEARGQFGDMFGAVNALFSGLAFAGLIITLILQKQELGLQRDELEQTREELKNQRKEFEVQNKTLKCQQFEAALYNMLQLQQQIVNDLAYDTKTEGYNKVWARDEWSLVVRGRDFFRFSFEQMKHIFHAPNGETVRLQGMKEVLKYHGRSGYLESKTPSFFDHYFRHLYRILRFIDNNDELTFEEKYKYVGDVRGTLSRYELVWIYYNLIENEDFVVFKRMVEDYSLLKNLNENLLTLSAENSSIIQEKGSEYYKHAGFSMTDYEFFMTDVKGEKSKFYVSAFYSEKDLAKGVELARRYKQIIASE